MDLYREDILEHYRHPHNFGKLEDANTQAREANASCGDIFELQLRITESTITEARFRGVGCALSIAAGSLLTDTLKGKSLQEASGFGESDMLKLLGVTVSSMRMKCVTLPLRALQKALRGVSD